LGADGESVERVLRMLGLADERTHVSQPVAQALARLARERQILAKLSHPNMARLLDGGTTPLGRPYLVLEYVEGQAIDRHCEQLGLAAPARLGLLRTVCDAVAAAHRQLVVLDKTDGAETELHLAQAEARTGQGAAARQRLARLEPALKRWALPQPALFLQAQAWVARAERQPLEAAALFAEAADLLKPQGPDDALRQMLLMDRAEALAAANRPDEARRQLEALAPGVAPYPPTAVLQQRLRALRSTAWASGGPAASR
jgi:hypothetical protein